MSEQATEQQEQAAQHMPALGLSIAPEEVQAYLDQLAAELNESNAMRRIQVVKMRGMQRLLDQQTAALETATAEIAKLKSRKK